jgi:hypothetical protein
MERYLCHYIDDRFSRAHACSDPIPWQYRLLIRRRTLLRSASTIPATLALPPGLSTPKRKLQVSTAPPLECRPYMASCDAIYRESQPMWPRCGCAARPRE